MDNIRITLVDLTSDGCDSDEQLQELLTETLACCATAESLQQRQKMSKMCCLASTPPGKEEDDICTTLKEKINRYIKNADKYVAFTSLLLKSRAFHLSCSDEDLEEEGCLPVVELPRTRHGKPFIPDPTSGTRWTFSVSHQFPFVGIAQSQKNEEIGMDIVVFEPPNKKLYDSTDRFVRVFRDCFTEWEWSRIHCTDNDEGLLKEFYLRWSMKESYTKALGMGMGFDFGAFETRLQNIDDNEETSKGIWPSLESKEGIILGGDVVSGEDKDSTWSFVFLPLCSADHQISGCVCVCLRHTRETNAYQNLPKREWLSLSDLALWHRKSKG